MKINRIDRLVQIGIVCALIGAYPGDAQAHGVSVPWLQPGALDQHGIYLELDGPTKIRRWAPITIRVSVLNVNGHANYVLKRIDLFDSDGNVLGSNEPEAMLATQADRFAELQQTMKGRAGAAITDPDLMPIAAEIARTAFKWRVRLNEAQMKALFHGSKQADLEVRATVHIGEQDETVVQNLRLHKWPALPTGRAQPTTWRWDSIMRRPIADPHRFAASPDQVVTNAPTWFAGDQHVHSVFSYDAIWFHPIDSGFADEFGVTGIAAGLKWVILTDHSNVDVLDWLVTEFGLLRYYTEEMFNAGSEIASDFTQQSDDFTLLYSEEMGVHTSEPSNSQPAHLLIYPRDDESTGYILNDCDAGLFGELDCEDAETIFERVEQHAGLGFIAHPFQEGPFDLAFDEWDMWDVPGYAGLEIWSDKDGVFKDGDEDDKDTDLQAWNHWRTDLLLDSSIGQPQNGLLPPRPCDEFIVHARPA